MTFQTGVIIFQAVSTVAIVLMWSELTKRLRKRNETAEQAYEELSVQSAIRERELLSDLNKCKANFSSANAIISRVDADWRKAQADLGRVIVLYKTAAESADRLAPIVEQFIKDIDDTARLLNDDKAPALTAEREAIRLHHELLKLRAHEATN